MKNSHFKISRLKKVNKKHREKSTEKEEKIKKKNHLFTE